MGHKALNLARGLPDPSECRRYAHHVSDLQVSPGREQPLHRHDSGKSPTVQDRDVVHRLEHLPGERGTHLPTESLGRASGIDRVA